MGTPTSAWPPRRSDLFDCQAVEQYGLPESITVDAPTVLLTGSESPTHLTDSSRTVDDAMAQSTLVELAGVGHVGILNAPEKVGSAVRTVLPAR
ncbi:MAG: alpha/beta fold hydrolase [Haloarcula sp.]